MLLYSVKIMREMLKKPDFTEKFVKLGGFEHLLKCFLDLHTKKIENALSIKCLENLIMIIFELSTKVAELKAILLQMVDRIVPRCLEFIHMIVNFSLLQEEKR